MLLGGWLFLASVASFVAIFMAYLLWWSRLAWAFAADRFLPASLVQLHPRYGTPHRVLILYGVIYALLAAFPFEDLPAFPLEADTSWQGRLLRVAP